MIEKILGVVCLIASAALYDAERIANISGADIPVLLFVLGVTFLIAAYGRGSIGFIVDQFFRK